MNNIVYYITGHGLGHVTRSIVMINYLICSNNNHKLYIVSALDESLFIKILCNDCNLPEDKVRKSITFYKRVLDAGAIQNDALSVNRIDTLNTYYKNIYCNRQSLIDYESKWLQDNDISIALVDATPIAVRAAANSNCKVFILSNFGWDFIYSEMLKDLDDVNANLKVEYKKMIDQISEDYSCCNLFIQYPGICPVLASIESSKIIKAPLLCRLPKKTRDEMRHEYDIIDEKVLILGFGGHKVDYSELTDCLPDDWVCLVLGSKTEEMPKSSRFIAVSFDCYIPDLLIMADCCLGKVGYDFVSECLTANCPLIYISRSHWAEESYLVTLLDSYAAGLEMSIKVFQSGNWKDYLLQALTLKWKLKDYHNPIMASEIVYHDLISLHI